MERSTKNRLHRFLGVNVEEEAITQLTKEEQLVKRLQGPLVHQEQEENRPPTVVGNRGSDHVLKLMSMIFDKESGANRAWSLAWCEDDFRLSDLKDNRNWLVFTRRRDIERMENRFLLFHQCNATSNRCGVAKTIWQPVYAINPKHFGHFNSQVNQERVFWAVLKYIIDYGFIPLVARLRNVNLSPGVLGSDTTINYKRILIKYVTSRYDCWYKTDFINP